MKNLILNIHHLISLHHPRRIRHSLSCGGGGRCPIVIAVTILSGLAAQLQALVIRGDVTDSATGKPLTETSVTVAGTSSGAAADSAGRFIITGIPPGEWTVTASHLGYASAALKTPAAADTALLHFKLRSQAIPMKEVVFTATRTLQLLQDVPVATELVRGDEIRNRAAITAADALQAEIGLDVQEDFSGQGVTLQGIDPDKVLILVDGNRVIGRVNGSIDLDQIAAVNIKQIEVVKGAMSTLYGSEAIGGVVNIVTEPALVPFSVGADVQFGGYVPNHTPPQSDRVVFQSDNGSQGVNVGWRRGALGLRSALRLNHVGLMDIDPTTAHTEGINGSDRFNGDVRIDYDLHGPSSLIFTGRFMNEEKKWVEDSGLISVSVNYDDRETNRMIGSSAEIVCAPTDDDRYSAKVYYTGNYHNWRKLTHPYGRVRDFSRGDEGYGELSLLMTRRIAARHLATFGADGYIWDIAAHSEMGAIPSHYSSDLTAWDAFVQDEWQPMAGWTLLPGVRYERHEVYGDHWSPRLSLMWALRHDLKLRASAGFGYRAPSAKELYFTFNHASAGYVVYGNPDLKPEDSQNYSVSLEHTYKNSAAARLSFFFNDLRNLIDFDSVGSSDQYYTGVYRYGNIVSAWTRGMELEREFRVNSRLQAKIAYSFLDTRNRQTGNLLIRRPKHSARWSLDYHAQSWTAAVWGRYTGKMLYQSIFQTDDQQSDEWTQSYQLWNLSLARDLGRGFSAYIKVENLVDHTHPRYGPRAGRVVTVGVRWQSSSP